MPRDTNRAAALPHNHSTGALVKRIAKKYLRPYAHLVVAALLLMAISAAMTGAIAYMIKPILDIVLPGQNKAMIVPIALTVWGVFIVRGLASYGDSLLMAKVTQNIVSDIQKQLFDKFLTLDLTFFHDNPSGQLISRVINDVQAMRAAVSDTLTNFGKSLFTLIALLIVMFIQDWKLSLAALIVFPLAAWFVGYVGKRLREISRNLQNETASLSDRLSQIFQGIRQVQAYGMEAQESKRSHKAIDTVKKLNIKTAQIGNLSGPVNDFLAGGIVTGIILYGGYQAASGNITAGELGSFLGAFLMAYEPMKKLAKINNALQTGLGAAERVFEMVDTKSRIEDKDDAEDVRFKAPQIAFKDVGFQYEDTDEKALKTISFEASAGQVTALVGPSGAGKTTIMNLIPRFYNPTSGEIVIEGHVLSSISLSSLRSQIALVSQDITIFDDTIAANIGYGRFGADQTEIERVAKAANAHDFIESFPEGYSTIVGEDGVKLSGGQRQRIAIARAILRDAPILLLDEATSALDNESERAVQEALKKLEEGRTTLVIAHRLSTVQEADQIIVLKEGEIVEIGKHDELLKKNGLYASMYKAGLKE